MTQAVHTFSRRVSQRVALDYLLHLPPAYSRRDKFPLILFLHGSGERGSDVNAIKKHGIPKIVEQQADFPFITLAPQCPANSTWLFQRNALLMLLDQVMTKYAVDKKRVYLTGISMGGYGAWFLGSEHPERFAAVVPICGGFDDMLGYPERVAGLRYTPVWAFHGAKDTLVPLSETTTMVKALRKAGGKVKLTVYPDAGHDSWTRTYDNPRLYRWLLQHHR
jgi:predicted peptidase